MWVPSQVSPGDRQGGGRRLSGSLGALGAHVTSGPTPEAAVRILDLRSSLRSLEEPWKDLGRNYLVGNPLTPGARRWGGGTGIAGKWEERGLVGPCEE